MTLLRWATATLEEAGVPRPRWNAEQLLSSALGVEPISLYLEDRVVGRQEELRFRRAVAQRADGEPLQYLLGSAAFYGREFWVGPGVFIPRPETEVLVETALKILAQRLRDSETQKLFVLDVGTGSGAIAITLVLESPRARLSAVEKSPSALGFAKRNALRHQADVAFFQGDLLHACREKAFDLLVANPPYLDAAGTDRWPRELGWEPRISLDGGEKGLFWIERIMRQATTCVRPGGHLVMEIGDGQGRALRQAQGERTGQAQGGAFQLEEIVPDLAGKERVVVLRKREEELAWRN